MRINKPDNIYGGVMQRVWVSYRKADIFVRKFEISTEVLIGAGPYLSFSDRGFKKAFLHSDLLEFLKVLEKKIKEGGEEK